MGYIVRRRAQGASEPEAEESAQYDTLTAAELKKLAAEAGISGYGGMRKAELVEALEEIDALSPVEIPF